VIENLILGNGRLGLQQKPGIKSAYSQLGRRGRFRVSAFACDSPCTGNKWKIQGSRQPGGGRTEDAEVKPVLHSVAQAADLTFQQSRY